MNNQKFVLFGEWVKEPKMHDVSEEISLNDLKQLFRGYSELESVQDEEIHIFIEDEDDEITELTFKEKIKKVGKHRFHGHRCKKIDVQVSYNGHEYCHEFNPATTGKKIMHWLKKEAQLSQEEIMQHELSIGTANGEVMHDDSHLGTFVTFPQCHLQLFLVPKDRYQG